MEDINVMPGINFKANKERIRARKIKENKKNKMFKTAIVIILAVAVIGILFINKNMTDSAMKSCQNMGNTYEYCIAHI